MERIRSIRTAHFRYVKHFMPVLPRFARNDYARGVAANTEIEQLVDAGKLTAPEQWQLWAMTKPHAEELYDLRNDPHEIVNLATDPAYADVLGEMRELLKAHQDAHGDLGMMDEWAYVRQIWPNGKQPVTAAPEVTCAADGTLMLRCPTEGASLGWRYDGETTWRVYTHPFQPEAGKRIQLQAHRPGYTSSTGAYHP